MDNLTFVTSNKDKVRETEEILDRNIDRSVLELEEIQETDLSEVVEKKARDAYKKLEKPVIVDDTGLFLEEWNGFPGALTKWILKFRGAEGFCKLVEENPEATARTAIGLCIDGDVEIFTGSVKGRIAAEPRGENGFGWDPVFIPEEQDETFAEMSSEEKNRFSMRNEALEKLEEFLQENE